MSEPRLKDAFAAPDTKRRYVRRLFATIADRYDLITRLLSWGGDQRWKRRLTELVPFRAGDRVLDLACGTGDLAFAAAARGARVIGLDITPRMLVLARAKTAGAQVTWIVGDMGALPIASASCQAITTGYGLRNVPDLTAAIDEIVRVLAPGGVVGSLDFDRPESPIVRAIYLRYLTIVGGVLGWVLHRDPDTYRYIPASIRRYPGAPGVAEMMRRAGLVDVRHVPLLAGFMALHVGRKPTPLRTD
ncbi:MAG TPA: ubiquinone/menaquinone biosynthesis methyltransferase [Vicinamibacterales bacterium]|nr:ubiquinone/menaquinone biosynthesis methyltransferase [Vicinamibacterales bacterium]